MMLNYLQDDCLTGLFDDVELLDDCLTGLLDDGLTGLLDDCNRFI